MAGDVKRPRGRPRSELTAEVRMHVLSLLRAGVPYSDIQRDPELAANLPLRQWMDRDPRFLAEVARARELRFERLLEETVRIADTPLMGETVTTEVTTGPDGDESTKVRTVREDMLGHRRLQVETRFKFLPMAAPDRYGPKTEVKHSGSLSLAAMVRDAAVPKQVEETDG